MNEYVIEKLAECAMREAVSQHNQGIRHWTYILTSTEPFTVFDDEELFAMMGILDAMWAWKLDGCPEAQDSGVEHIMRNYAQDSENLHEGVLLLGRLAIEGSYESTLNAKYKIGEKVEEAFYELPYDRILQGTAMLDKIHGWVEDGQYPMTGYPTNTVGIWKTIDKKRGTLNRARLAMVAKKIDEGNLPPGEFMEGAG